MVTITARNPMDIASEEVLKLKEKVNDPSW